MSNNLNDVFFGNRVTEGLTYEALWEEVQKYCTEQHTSTLTAETDKEKARALLMEIIENYIVKRKYVLEGFTTPELVERLYEDMAGISDGVKVIIAVVLDGLLLAALTLIFNDTIIPRITREIQDLFG